MNLIISFKDQEANFTHGVELGRILNKIQNGESPVENNGFPVRVENRNVLTATCRHYNYTPIFSDCSVEGWVNFIAIKNQEN